MPFPIPAPYRRIPIEPLTHESFAPFGNVIQNPTLAGAQTGSLPSIKSVSANQGTAVKFIDITHMINFYHLAPSKKPARAVMNMFSCSPRKLRPDVTSINDSTGGNGDVKQDQTMIYDVNILERHPFTPQTFIPLGLSGSDNSTQYLVIVAPTLPASSHNSARPPPFPKPEPRKKRSRFGVFSRARPSPYPNDNAPASSEGAPSSKPKGPGLPDLQNIRAFFATGDQAITYGAGTWHAPMAVLGQGTINFVVVQFANDVGPEDCQEVSLNPQGSSSNGISVVISDASRKTTTRGPLRAKL